MPDMDESLAEANADTKGGFTFVFSGSLSFLEGAAIPFGSEVTESLTAEGWAELPKRGQPASEPATMAIGVDNLIGVVLVVQKAGAEWVVEAVLDRAWGVIRAAFDRQLGRHRAAGDAPLRLRHEIRYGAESVSSIVEVEVGDADDVGRLAPLIEKAQREARDLVVANEIREAIVTRRITGRELSAPEVAMRDEK